MQTLAEPANILVVDDTEEMRELLSTILKRRGYSVETVASGAEMDVSLKKGHVDVILLDSMMPEEDGLSICKRLQGKASPPIIMVSALSGDTDRIQGLDLGAEDYIVKPFNPEELAARIRVVLRRERQKPTLTPPASRSHLESIFGWELDNHTRKLTCPTGCAINLSTAEFAVLRVLLDNPDRPLKREFILLRMAELYAHSTARALDTIVSRLRKKMEEACPELSAEQSLIQTVYGTGYMLRPAS